MKIIYNVAKNELKTLFCSPIAWCVLILVAFQIGFSFQQSFSYQLSTMGSGYSLRNLTIALFVNPQGGLFMGIQKFLYIYFPLLTMGLMAREYSNGSVKLLFSSPVTDRQIILGKYLAMLVYILVLVAITLVFLVFGAITIINFNYNLILVALLGFYLLLAVYSAIGLFMSTLTSYQVVAAIATLAVLIICNFIGDWCQSIPFVRDLTNWLSLKSATGGFYSGILCVKDVMHLFLMCVLFVALTIVYFKGLRLHRTIWQSVKAYGIVVIVILLLGYVTSSPRLNGYLNTNPLCSACLIPQHEQIVNTIEDDEIEVTMYVNLLDDNASYGSLKSQRQVQGSFSTVMLEYPHLKFKRIFYYHPIPGSSIIKYNPGKTPEELARMSAKSIGVGFSKVYTKSQIDSIAALTNFSLQPDAYRVLFRFTNAKGNSFVVPLFYTEMFPLPNENNIVNAINNLQGKFFKVAYVVGHNERSIKGNDMKDYSNVLTSHWGRSSYANSGFNFTQINLATVSEEELKDYDIMFIADPRSAFTDAEMAALDTYIANGGHLFILSEPNRQIYTNPILAKFGLKYSDYRLCQQSKNHVPDLIGGLDSKFFTELSTYAKSHSRYYKLALQGAIAIDKVEDKGFNFNVMVQTDSTLTWLEKQSQEYLDFTMVSFDEATEQHSSYNAVVALDRMVGDKAQRIIVSGDADWLDNEDFSMYHDGISQNNSRLLTEFMRWMTQGKYEYAYPLMTKNEMPDGPDNKFRHLDPKKGPIYNTFLIALLPLVLLIIFMTITAIRRSK